MIEIIDLEKEYPRKVLFNKLNFQINEGDFVVVMGESGGGKSTLLNLIGGLEEEYSGRILIDSVEAKNYKNLLKDKVTYLFQNYALMDNETVRKNLLIALKGVKEDRRSKDKLVKEALQKVGLPGVEDEKIYNLSGGEQQRVALARLILKDNDIILADEPTGNLDSHNSDKVIQILEELNKEGKTIVMVTHNEKFQDVGNRMINI